MKVYINYWGHELHFPKEVAYYSDELMWVKVEPDNKLRIGISDIGVRSVKYLDYVKLKVRSAGKEVKKGDLLAMVDTSKMVWEMIAPVSGKVVEVNPAVLNGYPGPILEDNYGAGWVYVLGKTAATDGDLQKLHKVGDIKTEMWIEDMIQKIVPLEGVERI